MLQKYIHFIEKKISILKNYINIKTLCEDQMGKNVGNYIENGGKMLSLMVNFICTNFIFPYIV